MQPKNTEDIREEQSRPRQVGDMKHGLTGSRPQISILPRTGVIYGGRAIEYGADKYARGNYHGPPPEKLVQKYGELGAQAVRLLGYIDATCRHLLHVSDAINRALGTGGDLKAACAIVDDEASGNFPPSMLPHLSHALASMLIGVSCAVDGKLIPSDPGQPWKALLEAEQGLPQKDNPAAERDRVAALAIRNELRGGDVAIYEEACRVLRTAGMAFTPANVSRAMTEVRAAMDRTRPESRQARPVYEVCNDPACPALERPEDLHSHPKTAELEALDHDIEKGFRP